LASTRREGSRAGDPARSNNFAAWHNNGDLNYRVGDFWATNDHSKAACDQRVHTCDRAESAIGTLVHGRGWAYLTMNDGAHAEAEFQVALKLDPSL
jgi:hypothetical protein